MLTPTLRKGLEHYRIGEKLRRLRLRKKLGLVQLGEHTGLSPALLSKLERGQLFPTLPTLLRISLVYSVGLDHFFTLEGDHPVVVVRSRERIALPETGDSRHPAFTFECLDFPAVDRTSSAYFVRFQPLTAEQLRRHEHPGSEFIYIMSGKLELAIGERRHVLRRNDSVYFDSSLAHSYRRLGKAPCTAILVTVP